MESMCLCSKLKPNSRPVKLEYIYQTDMYPWYFEWNKFYTRCFWSIWKVYIFITKYPPNRMLDSLDPFREVHSNWRRNNSANVLCCFSCLQRRRTKAQHATAAAAPANERGRPRKRSGLEAWAWWEEGGRYHIKKQFKGGCCCRVASASAAGPKSKIKSTKNPKRAKARAVPREAPIKNSLLSAREKAKDSSEGWANMPRLPTTNSCSFSHTHTEKFSGLFQC